MAYDIPFWGNQKNIGVGLSGRNNANSGLFTKKSSDIPTISETELDFLSRTDVFQKRQLFSNFTLNLARFDT